MNDSPYRMKTQSSEVRGSESKRKFHRNSPLSNKSNSSKSSEDSSVPQKFIKFSKISKASIDPQQFFQGFSTELVSNRSQQLPRQTKKELKCGSSNSLVQLNNLRRQLIKRQVQYEQLETENERIKASLSRQVQKRKSLQVSLKNHISNSSKLQTKVKEYQGIMNHNQKEIKYLQSKLYSKQQREMFSFKEKGLLEQIKRLNTVNASNSSLIFLNKEIKRLNMENEVLREQNHHLKIKQTTIIGKLMHFQKQLKIAIIIEQDFLELRQKYQQLARKQRICRKQLQQLKSIYSRGQSKQDSLTYSSLSNHSLPDKFIKQNNSNHTHIHQRYRHSQKKPNGS